MGRLFRKFLNYHTASSHNVWGCLIAIFLIMRTIVMHRQVKSLKNKCVITFGIPKQSKIIYFIDVQCFVMGSVFEKNI